MEVDIPSEYAIFAGDELRNTSTKNVFSFLLIYPSLMNWQLYHLVFCFSNFQR